MYKCQLCNKVSNPRESQNFIIIEKRDRNYHYYILKIKGSYRNKTIITEQKPNKQNKDIEILKEKKSRGWEIVKVLIVCKECIKKEEQ